MIIAGGGLKGIGLAQPVGARGHDVLVGDPHPAVCAYIQEEVSAMAFVGAATNTQAVEAIGLRRADVAVALMPDDANNLAFILLAHHAGVPQRLARMREQDFEGAYWLAGATDIASSVGPVVDQLVISIEYPEIRSLMRLAKGNIDVFEVPVPDHAEVVGMSIGEIAQMPNFPHNCNFVAVETADGKIEIAKGTTIVPPGANVVVLAMDVDLGLVLKLLTKRAPSRKDSR